jgi:hypothetical protein
MILVNNMEVRKKSIIANNLKGIIIFITNINNLMISFSNMKIEQTNINLLLWAKLVLVLINKIKKI